MLGQPLDPDDQNPRRFRDEHDAAEAMEAFVHWLGARPRAQRRSLLLAAAGAAGLAACGPQQEAAQQHRHTPWMTTYEAIHALYAQGTLIATIARQLGISRPTVYA